MSTLKPATKIYNTTSQFFAGRQIHRFQAEQFGEHALHSTVSRLETLGLKFERKSISVPTRYGRDCWVKLYWLAPESYPLAAKMLGLNMHVERSPAPDARAYLFQSRGGA